MTYWFRLRKFNENHDPHSGEFSSGPSGSDLGSPSLIDRMVTSLRGPSGNIEGNMGFTIDARTKDNVKSGYAVDPFPNRSLAIDTKDISKEALTLKIKDWIHTNQSVLKDHRLKIGGWVDPESMKIWLGVTRVYEKNDKDLAIAMGKHKNQISIADLGAIARGDMENAFISTGGTGLAKGDKPKTLVLFDNDATADEIAQVFMDHLGK